MYQTIMHRLSRNKLLSNINKIHGTIENVPSPHVQKFCYKPREINRKITLAMRRNVSKTLATVNGTGLRIMVWEERLAFATRPKSPNSCQFKSHVL